MSGNPENCQVKGCKNTRSHGRFQNDICSACWDMITSGEVHKNNPTFIGGLYREALERRNSINPQGQPVED